MSRAERERSSLASARWPALQAFFGRMPHDALEKAGRAPKHLADLVEPIELEERIALARECRDWDGYFVKRYDDCRFIEDGFGLTISRIGNKPVDHIGRRRMKLLYDALAASVRRKLGSD